MQNLMLLTLGFSLCLVGHVPAKAESAQSGQSDKARAATYATQLMRDLRQAPYGEDKFKMYALALNFARMPFEGGGLNFNAEEAHDYAISIVGRRLINQKAIESELYATFQFYDYLHRSVSEGGLALPQATARDYAVEYASKIPLKHRHGRLIAENEAQEAFLLHGIVYDQKMSVIDENGLVTGTSDRFAYWALLKNPAVFGARSIEWDLGFKDAFEFGLRPKSVGGLGLTLTNAGKFASDILKRRRSNVKSELNGIKRMRNVFKSSPTFARRSTGDLNELARTVVRDLDVVSDYSLNDLEETVVKLDTLIDLPIAGGGLGLNQAQRELEFIPLLKMLEQSYHFNKLQTQYQMALATSLNEQVKMGQYDEVTARDFALSRVHQIGLHKDMRAHLENLYSMKVVESELPAPLAHDYPRISRGRRIVRKVKSCVVALVTKIKEKISELRSE